MRHRQLEHSDNWDTLTTGILAYGTLRQLRHRPLEHMDKLDTLTLETLGQLRH